jgi:hypothetical protein
VPLGALIRNQAGIYFDFNDPVITNRTELKIAHKFLETTPVNIAEKLTPKNQKWVNIAPNPTIDQAIATLIESKANGQNYRYSLYSIDGLLIENGVFKDGKCSFPKQKLAKGLYFFQLENGEGKGLSWEKLVIE